MKEKTFLKGGPCLEPSLTEEEQLVLSSRTRSWRVFSQLTGLGGDLMGAQWTRRGALEISVIIREVGGSGLIAEIEGRGWGGWGPAGMGYL